MKRKFSRKLLAAAAGALTVFLLSALFRDAIASRDLAALERATGAPFAPFLVESAVMASYVNRVADGKAIAGVDAQLPAMAHRPVAEQMTLGLEYAGGWTLRVYRAICGAPQARGGEYEISYAETRFLRRAFTVFLALVPTFLYLMLLRLHVPWFIALPAALVETVSAAAVGRYTGQDLIKGAFAFPFLAAYLWSMAGALHGTARGRKIALIGVWLSAFCAAAFWDASQIFIGALALLEILRLACGGDVSRKRRDLWLFTFLALALAALLPYQRVHGTFFSPVLQFAVPAALLGNWVHFREKFRRSKRLGTFAGILVWSILLTHFSPFAGNYSHFGELAAAKLRFHNTLPADPSLLTFDQRFLWTPELHSADWKLLRMVFPVAVPLLALLALWALIWQRRLRVRRRYWGAFWQFALLAFLGVAATVYFARFRDVTMLMTAPALGMGVTLFFVQGKRGFRWSYPLLLALILAGETVNTWRLHRAYPEGLNATAALIRELRKTDWEGKRILADMQLSPLLKCYTNAEILIQPKYELPEVRALMQNYLELFFNAPIAEFETFCAAHRVDYVIVHCPMVTTPMDVPYSYRYMTCRKTLKLDSAAAILAIGVDGSARHFREIPLPAAASGLQGYRLYRFIPPDAPQEAGNATTELGCELRNGDWQGKVILSDVQLAPLLECCTDAEILIQPNYELPEDAALMQDVLKLFFFAPIAEFEAFCAARQVDYVIVPCPRGLTQLEMPYSYRAMGNKYLYNSAAAILTIGEDGMARHFREIPLPAAANGFRGYRLFRFISPEAQNEAEKLAEAALEAHYLGNHRQAKKLIRKAYDLAPILPPNRKGKPKDAHARPSDGGQIYEDYVQIFCRIPPTPALPKRKNK